MEVIELPFFLFLKSLIYVKTSEVYGTKSEYKVVNVIVGKTMITFILFSRIINKFINNLKFIKLCV